LADGQEAVGVVAGVREPGQPVQPVRREQPQRLPAFPPPRVGHLAALQHDVVDRVPGQEVTGRESCVPGADDDGCDLLDDVSPQATSTATSVGLVSASNTAERFCDCATRASISSRDASASMLNVTLMSLYPLRTSGSAPRIPRISW